ncbi:uncharacterized protein LOC141532351 isoform X2 [Cotesia typhae]|uniref:uncharacterized protein LOC141532351 isoform X2 n=1 Tax=Cotesia typhae TaxID=2053667 RepID=UPI003D681A2B
MYTYVLILQLVAVFSVLAVERAISTTYLLGYPCLIHSDCPDHAGCYSSQCSCYSGYRADNGLCVKYATKVGDSCSESFLVCKGVQNTYCSDNICKCRWGYTKVGDNCRPTLNGTCVFNSHVTDQQCYGDGVTCSKSNKCICQPDYVQHIRECVKRVALDAPCSSDLQCTLISNTFCHSTCQCRPTYTHGSCQCDSVHYEYNNDCSVKQSSLNLPCNHYNACRVSNSICYDRKCQCDWNYFEKDGSCLKGLHSPCESQDECKREKSDCIDKKCACKPNFKEYLGECRSVTSVEE